MKFAFYGIGNDTVEDDKTAFTYTPISFGVGEIIDITDNFHVGGDFSYEKYDTEEGNSSTDPSLEEVFPVEAAPGFGQEFGYLVGNVFARIRLETITALHNLRWLLSSRLDHTTMNVMIRKALTSPVSISS